MSLMISENVPLGPKTTMRIGGRARYFAELKTKQDVEDAWRFAREHRLPLVPLGAGSNTVFADGTVAAVVVHITHDAVEKNGNTVRVGSGKFLATLLSELAKEGLDLSALSGIPGTVGGAVFGNAGQGPKGVWTDSFLVEVEIFIDGSWKTLRREECGFGYRDSIFKRMPGLILWKAVFLPPARSPKEIETEVQKLLQHRRGAQISGRTAGSCFKGLPDGTPAWQLIDAAGLRGLKIGGVQISEKHANFLVNIEEGTFSDVSAIIERVRKEAPEISGVEMRLYGADGRALPLG